MSDRPRSKALPGILLSPPPLMVGFLLGMWLWQLQRVQGGWACRRHIVLAWGCWVRWSCWVGAIALWAAAARRAALAGADRARSLARGWQGSVIARLPCGSRGGPETDGGGDAEARAPHRTSGTAGVLPVSGRAATEGAVVIGLGMASGSHGGGAALPERTPMPRRPPTAWCSSRSLTEQHRPGPALVRAGPPEAGLRHPACGPGRVAERRGGGGGWPPNGCRVGCPTDQVQLLWPEFLLGVYALEPLIRPGIRSRIKPLDHATGRPPLGGPAHPTVVRGRWMRVTTEGAREGGQVVEGWLRWTDGERLLVRYDLLS